MTIEQVEELFIRKALKAVNFIEAGHAPLVIELEYIDKGKIVKALLKDKRGVVATYCNINEGYEVCSSVGIHEANLVHIETDDEVSTSDYASYHRECIPLTF